MLPPLAVWEESVHGRESFSPVTRIARAPMVAFPVEEGVDATRPATSGMDVFGVHHKLIEDYWAFARGNGHPR